MASKPLKYIMLFYTALDEYRELTDEQFGRLIRAGLTYARDGTEMVLSAPECYMFPVLQNQINMAKEEYQRKCERNTENAKKPRFNRTGRTFSLEAEQPDAENDVYQYPIFTKEYVEHILKKSLDKRDRIQLAKKQLITKGYTSDEIQTVVDAISPDSDICDYYAYIKSSMDRARMKPPHRQLPVNDFEQRSYADEEDPITRMIREKQNIAALSGSEDPVVLSANG
ncbi:MAG: DUF6291 domain-containing protein [Clostridia bacterium]|nr:DUF6291 domain-containing protein [Clostridia bacterium]